MARLEFFDRTLTAADLDGFAAFWSHCCCLADKVGLEHWNPEYALELRLSGFPRANGASLLAALTRRYVAQGIVVTLADSDTLIVEWKGEILREPPGGLGLGVVAHEAFERLVVEIRLAVYGRRVGLESTTATGRTLVLVGELRARALFLKALWGGRARASRSAIIDTPTQWDLALLNGFEEFLKSGQVNAGLATVVDFPPPWHSETALIQWITAVPFERPRLRGLLTRSVAFAAALVGFLAAIKYHVPYYVTVALVGVWFFLLLRFVRNEGHFLFASFGARRAAHAASYSARRYVILTPEQVAFRLDDPAVRKYSVDLLDAGFVHIGDVAEAPLENTSTIYRVFHAPEGVTSLALRCTTWRTNGRDVWPLWPATVGFECQTFFSDGGRIDSVTDEDHPTGVTDWPVSTRLMAFPTATHPRALYELHRDVVDEVRGEMAVTPVRHEPLEVYLRRQEEISEAEHRAATTRPYSWRDHLRWYLQLDAKPPAESK